MTWFGQSSNAIPLIFLFLQSNNANIIKRSAQVLDVEPHTIELTFGLKYVSEDIAKTLYRKDKQNTLVYEFCSLMNEQVGVYLSSQLFKI